MALTEELEIIFYIALIFHIIVSVVIIIVGIRYINERTKYLPFLFCVNMMVFVASILIGTTFVDFQIINYVAFMIYSMIIGYVVTIEIPGYVLLSRYDSKLTTILQNIRRKSIQLNYNIDEIKDLRSYFDNNKQNLSSIIISDLVESFLKRCETIKNLDKSLYEITVKELGEQIQFITSRSKHPFPKLIEIFSLAGISFLLMQFLNYIF